MKKLFTLLAAALLLALPARAQIFNAPAQGPTTAQFLSLSNSVATNAVTLNGAQTVAGAKNFTGAQIITNSANVFAGDGSGLTGVTAGILTSNGFGTNTSFYSSGTTNWAFLAQGTNATRKVYVDKDASLVAYVPYTGGSESAFVFATDSFNPYVKLGFVSGNLAFGGFAGTDLNLYANSTIKAALSTSINGIVIGSSKDVGISRVASGVLTVNTGASDTDYRDVKLRTLLAYAQASDPASSATFGQIYAKTNAGTTEVFVQDGAGNVTQISPHARASSPAPVALDAADKTPVVIYHKNLYTGEEQWLHLSAMARKLEALTGEKFVYSRQMPPNEVRDWGTEQTRQQAESDAEIAKDNDALAKWQADPRPPEKRGPKPAVRARYQKAPKPSFLK